MIPREGLPPRPVQFACEGYGVLSHMHFGIPEKRGAKWLCERCRQHWDEADRQDQRPEPKER